MSLTLPNNVWSPEDLKELIGDINRYAHWLADFGIRQRVSNTKPIPQPPTLSATAVSLLHDMHDQHALTPASIDKLLADLQAIDVIAPRVNFTFAAAPSNGLKKE